MKFISPPVFISNLFCKPNLNCQEKCAWRLLFVCNIYCNEVPFFGKLQFQDILPESSSLRASAMRSRRSFLLSPFARRSLSAASTTEMKNSVSSTLQKVTPSRRRRRGPKKGTQPTISFHLQLNMWETDFMSPNEPTEYTPHCVDSQTSRWRFSVYVSQITTAKQYLRHA